MTPSSLLTGYHHHGHFDLTWHMRETEHLASSEISVWVKPDWCLLKCLSSLVQVLYNTMLNTLLKEHKSSALLRNSATLGHITGLFKSETHPGSSTFMICPLPPINKISLLILP